tara:strand:+ start:48749 stop:50371 length:1623 start_codon:yes stop_codon:yes gene_type:complete
MALETNPNLDIRWAEISTNVPPSNSPNKTEPLTRHKDAGWDWKEKPSFSRFNMWMNRVWKQVDWASDCIDVLVPVLDLVIDEDLELHVSTTGDDTTGDGTVSLPWATPQKAYEFLQGKIVPDGVTVTIRVAAGEYISSSSLNIGHPDGDRIFLVGEDLVGGKPYGMPIGDYSVDRNAPVVPAQGVNEFQNTAGTLPANSSAPTRTTARSNDLAANEALIRSRYQTIFTFNNVSGINSVAGSGNVDKIAVLGTRTVGTVGIACGGNPGAVAVTYGGHISVGTQVAVHGFHEGVIANVASSVLCDSVTVTGCSSSGLVSQFGGAMICRGSNIQGCDLDGIQNAAGGSMLMDGSVCSGNGRHGSSVRGSVQYISSVTYPIGITLSGNGNQGIIVIGSAGASEGSNAVISGNGDNGIATQQGGSVLIKIGCSTVGNDGSGVLSAEGSVDISGNCLNNGGGGLVALGSGSITTGDLVINNTNDDHTPGSGTNSGIASIVYSEGQTSINIADAGVGNVGAGVTFSPAHGVVGNGSAINSFVQIPTL